MIISSILAVVVFAVMFIMAARDKLSRPAVMGMSAVGAVLLLFGAFIGLSRSDDQMLYYIIIFGKKIAYRNLEIF